MTAITSCEAVYVGNEETTAYFNFLQNGTGSKLKPNRLHYVHNLTMSVTLLTRNSARLLVAGR